MLVSNWAGRQIVAGTSVLSVIDEGNGLKVEIHGGVYRHKREHCCGVGQKRPIGAPVGAIDGIEQGTNAPEEENNDDS